MAVAIEKANKEYVFDIEAGRRQTNHLADGQVTTQDSDGYPDKHRTMFFVVTDSPSQKKTTKEDLVFVSTSKGIKSHKTDVEMRQVEGNGRVVDNVKKLLDEVK